VSFTIIIVTVSSSGGGGGGGGGGSGATECPLTSFYVFLIVRTILLTMPRPIPHFSISPYIFDYLTDKAIS